MISLRDNIQESILSSTNAGLVSQVRRWLEKSAHMYNTDGVTFDVTLSKGGIDVFIDSPRNFAINSFIITEDMCENGKLKYKINRVTTRNDKEKMPFVTLYGCTLNDLSSIPSNGKSLVMKGCNIESIDSRMPDSYDYVVFDNKYRYTGRNTVRYIRDLDINMMHVSTNDRSYSSALTVDINNITGCKMDKIVLTDEMLYGFALDSKGTAINKTVGELLDSLDENNDIKEILFTPNPKQSNARQLVLKKNRGVWQAK